MPRERNPGAVESPTVGSEELARRGELADLVAQLLREVRALHDAATLQRAVVRRVARDPPAECHLRLGGLILAEHHQLLASGGASAAVAAIALHECEDARAGCL